MHDFINRGCTINCPESELYSRFNGYNGLVVDYKNGLYSVFVLGNDELILSNMIAKHIFAFKESELYFH